MDPVRVVLVEQQFDGLRVVPRLVISFHERLFAAHFAVVVGVVPHIVIVGFKFLFII